MKNAFFGYSYQKMVTFFLLVKMDVERNLQQIEIEADIENNFDDVFIKAETQSIYCQMKDYKSVKISDLKIIDDQIYIKGDPHRLSSDKNVLFIKSIDIETNTEIFGLGCLDYHGIFIVPVSREDIWEYICYLYSNNEQRIPKLLKFFDTLLDERKLIINRSDLPHIDIYSTELIDKTIKLNDIELNDSSILRIEGKPGIGKSHLVDQLKMHENRILYRFWISNQDKNYKERLIYKNFISNITKELFQDYIIRTENEIISKLSKDNKTLIIDGLDHVENYNFEDFHLFIDFINRVGLKSKVIVLTRPLKSNIKWETVTLNNWSFNQTEKFLDELYHITQYDLIKKIYKLTDGYAILVTFLAKHLKEFKTLPDIREIDSISDYYDQVIKNVNTKSALSIFLTSRSYFMQSEINDLLEDELATIIMEFISSYPYLFDIRLNRISLVHDSFNTYLRNQEINYNKRKEIVQNIVFESIINGEKRYLCRLCYFELPKQMMIDIINKYSSIKEFQILMDSCIDFEAVRSFYHQIRKEIGEIGSNVLSLSQYYDLSLIYNIIHRDELTDRNGFLYTYVNSLLMNGYSEEDITSSEYLFSFLYFIKNEDIQLVRNVRSEDRYEIENIYDELMFVINEEDTYFDKHKAPIKLSKEVLVNKSENEVKDMIIEMLINTYIHETSVSEFKEIHDSIILFVDKDEKEKAKLIIEKVLIRYGVRKFFAYSVLNNAFDRLESQGLVRVKNDYQILTLSKYIEKYRSKGTFELSKRVQNYLRLSLMEKRSIDITSIGKFWMMYYERKDYSVINLGDALTTFEKKGMISESESCGIIIEAQKLSEKGIRHILKDYIMLHDVDILEILEQNFDLSELQIEWFDLPVKYINSFSKEIFNIAIKRIIDYNAYARKVSIYDVENALISKKLPYVIDVLSLFKYSIEIPKNHYLYFKLKILDIELDVLPDKERENKERNSEDRFNEGILTSQDLEFIKMKNLQNYEVCAYTDGWYHLLADLDMFSIYSKEEMQKNINDLIFNAFLGKIKSINMYGNLYHFVGNVPKLFYIYEIPVDWDKIYSSFRAFLRLSLIG